MKWSSEKPKESMKPRDAKTFSQMCRLQSDNKSVKRGWILLDARSVILTNQMSGEASTGRVKFTRREFDALIDWYNRDQKLRRQ